MRKIKSVCDTMGLGAWRWDVGYGRLATTDDAGARAEFVRTYLMDTDYTPVRYEADPISVKCAYCGSWGIAKTKCLSCGATIDPDIRSFERVRDWWRNRST